MSVLAMVAASILLSATLLLAGSAQAAPGSAAAIIIVGGSPIKTFNPGGTRMLNPQPLPPRVILKPFGR